MTAGNTATLLAGDPPDSFGGGAWCETSGAVLSNCILTANSAYRSGGGAYQGTLNNCVLAKNSAGEGAGAALATLNSCIVTNNSARYEGGGAYSSLLNNCLVADNGASENGGGVSRCTLNNCTVALNTPPGAFASTLNNTIAYYHLNILNDHRNFAGGTLNYCCTTPLPASGYGNFTSAPVFVDQSHWNLRLQSNSPCINAGRNALAPAGRDLDGNPRIAGATVDVGAYEVQSPTSLISHAWLQQYGLPTDGSADFADPDSDGMTNWQEWRCGTNPTNALSVLRLLSPSSDPSGLAISWLSVTDHLYAVERASALAPQQPFQNIATNIGGRPGTTTITDFTANAVGPFFYRVGVQP